MSERITELVLPIKRKWFDMILNHKKFEEYREIKPYWTKRFQTIGLLEDDVPTRNKALITFRNGYGNLAPAFTAWVHLYIGTGVQEWGAEYGKDYYVLVLDKVNDLN